MSKGYCAFYGLVFPASESTFLDVIFDAPIRVFFVRSFSRQHILNSARVVVRKRLSGMILLMLKLDNRDIQILSILQREGRISKTALAARVNLSPTPCWERIKRLEEAGLIEGYNAILSTEVLGTSAIVFMQAELASHQARDFEIFERAVKSMDEVLECWAVGGGIDFILKVCAGTIDEYQLFVDRMLDANIGLKRYYSYVVTKRVKETNALPDTILKANLE